MPLPTPDRLAEAADPPTPAARGPGVLAADAQLIDRELSLLHFNRRVLALAEQPDVPVLERLRFLSIVGSNLDEFFEIRVAGLRGALRSSEPPPGMSLHEVRVEYARIAASAHGLVEQQYRVLNASVLPALRERGIVLERHGDRTPGRARLRRRATSSARCARC